MPNINDALISNENQDNVINISSDNNAENSTTSDQMTITSQLDGDAQVNETHQIINRPIVHQSDRYDLSSRQRILLPDHSDIGAIQTSTLSIVNRLAMNFGMSQPLSMDYETADFSQDNQGADRIASPSDQWEYLVIIYRFSTTITGYVLPPQENIGIEDTQPHDMPTTVVSNNIDLSHTFNYGDSGQNFNEISANTESIIDTSHSVTLPTQISVIGEESPTNALTIDSSSPQTLETERYVDVPTEDGLRAVLSETYASSIHDSKLPNTITLNNTSYEETDE